MTFEAANESYSVGIMERESTSNYILGLETETEKNDVYRRYLQNLNISSSNISMQNFAKMLYSFNSSIYALNATKQEDFQNSVSSHFDVGSSEVTLILLTVIYVIIFITGVLGNVVTCIVIAKNKGMHTAVNYYLFSLAVSDLLLLVSGERQTYFVYN